MKWIIRKSVKEKEIVLAKILTIIARDFFAYMSSKTKPKENIANLSLPDGTVTDRDKSEAFNSFFLSVFTVEDTENISPFVPRTGSTLSNVEVTVSSIQDRLAKLNVSMSEGPEGIHPRLLKELNEGLAFPLKVLFDKTPKEGKFKSRGNKPSSEKEMKLTPITIDQQVLPQLFLKSSKALSGMH